MHWSPPVDENLTERQAGILQFMVKYIRREQRSPSAREIMRGAGLASTGALSYQLGELARKRFIKMTGRFRGIDVLVNPFDESPVIPGTRLLKVIASSVPAGPLKPLPELVEGSALIDQRFFKSKKDEELFLIRVAGDSMTGAGINTGDWVLIRPQATANPGDLVIAVVDNEFTLKRFRIERGDVVLEAANPAHKSIRVPKDKLKDFRILGRVVKALKDFE